MRTTSGLRPACLLWAALAALPCLAATPSPLAKSEATYADWLDAVGALGDIDSGAHDEVAGRGRSAWALRVRQLTLALDAALHAVDSAHLSASQQRVFEAINSGRSENAPEATEGPAQPEVNCSAAADRGADANTLQLALYACFEEIGNHIQFENQAIVRTTALQQLQQLPQAERRKNLFAALSPLWLAVNDANTADSPYRRMMRRNGELIRTGGRSPVSAAALTLGISAEQAEQWLTQILEAWKSHTRAAPLEPWDYWYASAEASRQLSPLIPHDAVLPTAKRYYRDLGADLDVLGVQHDLEVRPGKAPLAYTEHVRIARRTAAGWRPTLARVSANYQQGGLFVLNELIHEDGHAVHYAALRTRPAYFSLGDDLFFESFADVPAWSVAQPRWQQRYLGAQSTESSSARELFSNVMLDVAWGLFELRMIRDPSTDPNLCWTDITARYLNIAPHPELSWWALRVQLVRWPGYMINYGLGAILTADIREHIEHAIGPFDAGNPRWYAWTSEHLLRFGSSVATPQLLREFLGRSPSPDALLRQIARIDSGGALARQNFGEAELE